MELFDTFYSDYIDKHNINGHLKKNFSVSEDILHENRKLVNVKLVAKKESNHWKTKLTDSILKIKG